MTGYAVARLDEIDELDDGRCPFRPVRHHFGITAFGTTSWTARNAGDRIINEHGGEDDDEADEELYVVIRGHAVFELDGETRVAPAGTAVFVRPGVRRTAFADEPGTTIVAVGAVPGHAYVPTGWELWQPFRPLYERGDYAEAADRARDALAADPPYPELFYNVACCESLAGRKADAIEHLRRAIELSDRVRAFAERDTDLDPIRDEPAVRALLKH